MVPRMMGGSPATPWQAITNALMEVFDGLLEEPAEAEA
ncbi:hypothetical protein ABID21_004713 [Pseudorhizobium tarimense]|uniref:Uncharacterized protein n=1 Tax=Pseudorhizobium tarimense TaxID=1079109 RepID=A0ABV2HEE6_9HYPH